MREAEQLMLPIEVRPIQEVSWYNVEVTEKKILLLGKKVVKKLIKDPKTSQAAETVIRVEEIDNLNDPDLRYALRFKAAALSAGTITDGVNTSGPNDVIIEATDEGVDSRYVSAAYWGVVTPSVDTFMRDLRRFAPQPEVPGMTSVVVPGNDGEPDTRFWVPQA
jgi:hypothetical protein